ncbi:MAG: two-component regulator propeller domain-containing protein [Bacteroidota bacterium]
MKQASFCTSLFWTICLVMIGPIAFGQEYNLLKLSLDEGLSQSQVFALLQDQKGYLWLGTHGGLNRFDGRNFVTIDDDSLAGNFLSSLIEDKEGNLWVGTNNGLTRYDGRTFKSFFVKDGLTSDNVSSLVQDDQGRIWIGTLQKGITILDEKGRFRQDPFTWESGTEHTVFSMIKRKDGRIWLGTDHGLFYEDGEQLQHWDNVLLDNANIFSMLEDRNGDFWIGTSNGVFLCEGNNCRAVPLLDMRAENLNVFTILEDLSGNIWLGTDAGLLKRQDNVLAIFEPAKEIFDYKIHSSLQDDEGNLWFGTDGGGVGRLIEGVFDVFGKKKGMTSDIAKAFLQDKQGRVWISTKDRGINLWENNQIVDVFTTEDGLGGNDIVSSFADAEGNFWFASYNGSLTCYNMQEGFVVFSRETGLECNAVYVTSQDREGTIWVGTDNGVFWLQDQKIVRHITEDDGLIHQVVFQLQPDRQGRMWVGTAEGISIWQDDAFSIQHAPRDSLVGNNVITMLEDKQGRMWVGSSVGLTCFNEDQPYWVKISGAPRAHTVVTLLFEPDQFLWIGTERGAYRLNLSTFVPGERARFDHFIKEDGLPSLEINANAAFLDQEGAVWLGTIEGAARKKVSALQVSSDSALRVYITSVRSDQAENWLSSVEDKSKAVQLSHNDNRVDVSFIGLSLRSPQAVEYRYRIVGLGDGKWSDPTHNTYVSIANLTPEEYIFEVVAKQESKPWNYDHPAQFRFEIRPAIWQTWWFRLIMLGLFGLGVWVVYQYYDNRRKQIREEQRIRDQAEKLALEHQALYAMMNPHFTFNALQSIQFFIHRQDKKAANKFLSSFAKLVRKNLESTKSDTITLSEEVDRLKLYLSLEKMRFPEKFDYEVEVDRQLELSDTQIPPMLLQPFVENSIKHGIMPLESGGMIKVLITEHDEDHLDIIIEDNGVGIEASRRKQHNRPNDHVSKGMQITKDRLVLFARMTHKKFSLDIKEIVEAGESKGTRVSMVMPVLGEDLEAY